MGVAWFRFYAELNDFLPADIRSRRTRRHLIMGAPVKDLIESFGVPHPEVELILINGEPSGFSARVRYGDQVSAYPLFHSLDISPIPELRPRAPQPPRFVLDVHLGRLAAYLRMLGFDSIYSNTASDAALAALASDQHRILLTRDRYLLMRSQVIWGHWIRSSEPREQLREVVTTFDLIGSVQPFTRCLDCNSTLEPVNRDSVVECLPPRVREKDLFHVCSGCGKVFWQGTHWERMNKIIAGLTEARRGIVLS